MGQVFQFFGHNIFAEYHSLTLHTYQGQTFESFDFLLATYNHVTSYHRNLESKIFLISSIDWCLKFQLNAFKLISPKNFKIIVPITSHKITWIHSRVKIFFFSFMTLMLINFSIRYLTFIGAIRKKGSTD